MQEDRQAQVVFSTKVDRSVNRIQADRLRKGLKTLNR
jgi:hypothetical protein